MQSSFPTFFPVFFLAVWIGVHWLISQISGWSRLARQYRCSDSYLGSWKGWQYGYFRGCGYKGCLWVGVAADGLHLKTGPWIFFRAFHPPLRIPWSAIKSVEPHNYWFVKTFLVELLSGEKFQLRTGALDGADRFLGEKMKTWSEPGVRP